MKQIKEFRTKCSACTACHLRAQTQVTQPVLPGGSKISELMVIGEVPGFFEDLYNEPFVGGSGKLLKESLYRVGLKAPYFTNIVKCRPVYNTNPEQISIDACSDWLMEEIKIMAPSVIITVGAVAAKFLLTNRQLGISLKDFKIGKYRGKIYEASNGIQIIPTWHPGYILRNRSAAFEFISDLKLAQECLEKIN